ncbi:MAG: hypothetical protein GXX92_06970 [Clostridiales bacterium]|nr:hypothetical protein [Clostridiales bacterium]
MKIYSVEEHKNGDIYDKYFRFDETLSMDDVEGIFSNLIIDGNFISKITVKNYSDHSDSLPINFFESYEEYAGFAKTMDTEIIDHISFLRKKDEDLGTGTINLSNNFLLITSDFPNIELGPWIDKGVSQ